ncbi:unnamed protein product, partial [Prorocentrum cordatum]
ARSDAVVLTHNVFTFKLVKRAANPQQVGGYAAALAAAMDTDGGDGPPVLIRKDHSGDDAGTSAEKRAKLAAAKAEARHAAQGERVGPAAVVGAHKQEEAARAAQGGSAGAEQQPGGGAQAVEPNQAALSPSELAGEGIDGKAVTEGELQEAMAAADAEGFWKPFHEAKRKIAGNQRRKRGMKVIAAAEGHNFQD